MPPFSTKALYLGVFVKKMTKSGKKAKRVINRLGSQNVYTKLRTQLPYKETRKYLQKVIIAKKEFVYL